MDPCSKLPKCYCCAFYHHFILNITFEVCSRVIFLKLSVIVFVIVSVPAKSCFLVFSAAMLSCVL